MGMSDHTESRLGLLGMAYALAEEAGKTREFKLAFQRARFAKRTGSTPEAVKSAMQAIGLPFVKGGQA